MRAKTIDLDMEPDPDLLDCCREYLACLYIRQLSIGMRRVQWHNKIAKCLELKNDNQKLIGILHNLDKCAGYDIKDENTDGKQIKNAIDKVAPKLVAILKREFVELPKEIVG